MNHNERANYVHKHCDTKPEPRERMKQDENHSTPNEMIEVVELKLCPPIIIPKDVGEEGFIIRSISIDPNNSPELIKWAYNYMCESVLPCKGEPEPGECNECRKRGENISCISLIAKILGLNIFPKKEVKK